MRMVQNLNVWTKWFNLLANEIELTDEQVDDFFEWAMNEEWKNN